MYRLLPLFLLFLSPLSLAHDVIGYLPGYRVNAQSLAAIDHCTDVTYFGSTIAADGRIILTKNADAHLRQIKTQIRSQKKTIKTRLILCLGGWKNDRHFPAATSSPESRKTFAKSLLETVNKYQLDGVDLDWEYPKNATEWKNLGKLVQTAKAPLGNRPFVWSAAVAAHHIIPAEVVPFLDRIHIMAYDVGVKHCDPAVSEAAIANWKKHGVSTNKLCIGAAFYGRNMKKRSDVKTYAQLLKKFGDAAKNTPTAGGYFYDDPAACRKKKQLVSEHQLRGIIVWEIGQDAAPPHSLLPHLK